MIGPSYWYTGVMLTYMGGQWCASIKFYDDGFCDDESTEGTLRCRYFRDSMADAIDLVVRDAARLGMVVNNGTGCTLYVEGDGEDPKVSLPPGWRALLRAECDRRGWSCLYSEERDS